MPAPQSVLGEIADDASYLLQALDPAAGSARFVRMDAASYRGESFLDDRMFARRFETHVVGWADVVASTKPDMPSDARWIFHIGHVGSTLIARLLGEFTLSVREPRALRDLALVSAEATDALYETMTRLFSRRLARQTPTVVKATSFVSEIAPRLCPAGQRALFLYAQPKAYICTMLAGENSRQGLAAAWPNRRRRLAGRAAIIDAEASEAHLAAAAWACEMTSLEAAATAMPDRTISWADFDDFLSDMPDWLARVLQCFAIEADPAVVKTVACGPLTKRYSKALEYEYSAALRRDLIGEAEQRHRPAIHSALEMLYKSAETSPLLTRALGRSSTAAEN